jgi:3-deoxy-manno-octulosonate cytidylyltransferase (CMP-KDO synthetase)
VSYSIIIPARLHSTRLPGKVLADIGGLPMVVRVARQAALTQAQQVVVAADDDQIIRVCEAHGVSCLLTRTDHPTGTDRLAQASEQLGLADDAVVVNVQGDEPLIPPALIDACAQQLEARSDCAISTAAHPITSLADWHSPSVVKVVCDHAHRALYFSRAPIPHWRDCNPGQFPTPAPLRHIGIYAYRVQFLRRYPQLSASPLEHLECLEQLRALWHGERIAVHLTHESPGQGVDTAQDLERVRGMFV